MVGLKRILRIIVKILAAFAVFIALYFAAVLTGGVAAVNQGGEYGVVEQTDSAGTASIYLYNNGRHFDVWLPARCCGFLGGSASGESVTGWYGFGWGDRDFFLNTPHAGDVKPGILLKALFLPSRSVLAVQYSATAPSGSHVTAKTVRESDAAAAAGYIAGWFMRSVTGGLLRVPQESVHPSYTGYRFYESRRRYTLFFTSNNWAAGVLKSAGLSTGLWTPLTFGVLR